MPRRFYVEIPVRVWPHPDNGTSENPFGDASHAPALSFEVAADTAQQALDIVRERLAQVAEGPAHADITRVAPARKLRCPECGAGGVKTSVEPRRRAMRECAACGHEWPLTGYPAGDLETSRVRRTSSPAG